MNSQRQKPPAPWTMIMLFSAISITIIVVGVLYYTNQKKILLKEKQIELSAISKLKISQITQWRIDRIGYGEFLGGNSLLVKNFSEFLLNSGNKQFRDDIVQSFRSLTEIFDFRNVLLLDNSGRTRLCLLYTSDAADEEDSVDLGG